MANVRLLIIDDEPLVRVGVKSILQASGEAFEVVGEAGDGESALALVKVTEPDIVLVDIRMPVMDGLELIAASKKEFPAIKYIVLSCLNEFEYARKAMKLGVTDYIIKSSIDTGELIDLLKKLSSEIEEEKKKLDDHCRERRQNHSNRLAAVKELFNSMVDGAAPLKDIEKELTNLGVTLPVREDFQVLVVAVDKTDELSAKYSARDYGLLKYAACNICQEILDRYCRGYALDKNTREIVVLAYPGQAQTGTETDFEEQVKEMAAGFIKMIDNYVEISCSVGISSKRHGVSEIHQAYKEATEAVNGRFYNGYGSVNCYLSSESGRLAEDAGLKTIGDNMLKMLLSSSCENFEEYFEQTISGIFREHVVSVTEARMLFCGLMFHIAAGIEERSEAGELPKIESLSYLNEFMESRTLEELKSGFKALAYKLILFYEENERKYNHSLVTRIKEFVVNNIGKEIDLALVAENMKVSPQYVSRLFRTKSGEGFNEFVTGEKMRVAKEMLKNNEKLWVIAEKIGYADIASFSRAFKRVEGLSPKQYRARLL